MAREPLRATTSILQPDMWKRVVTRISLMAIGTVALSAAADPGPAAYAPRVGSSSVKLMLFGGPGHETYLGCLNCSNYASDSVLNEFGSHGSRYSSESIFNPYGQFGSRYSQYSACNPYASDPPVIVDERGNVYGRLTVNRFHLQAVQDPDLVAWIEAVCR